MQSQGLSESILFSVNSVNLQAKCVGTCRNSTFIIKKQSSGIKEISIHVVKHDVL